MTKEEFLNELSEIMQLDTPLNGRENLKDLTEWDSMSSLGVMSMFDMEFGITLTADGLKNVQSISGLIALAGAQVSD